MRRPLLALLALLALAPAADAAVVRSGPAVAAVSGDPWHLEVDAGGPVLRELASTGSGPSGTLGFATAAGWAHATRVVREARDGEAWTATLATTDPLRRTLSVRIAPDAEGVLALAARVDGDAAGVTQTGIAFAGEAGERYLGFGERSDAVDRRGTETESYVSDGPYQPEERPLVAALVPPAGFRFRDDATYFPIPWVLSTRGYGVLVDDDTTTVHRMGSDRDGAWSVETAGAALHLRFFAGPKPADVLARYTARLGRQPAAAAPWYFGPWIQTPKGADDAKSLETLRGAGAPTSVMQTYTHFLPCADQRGKEAAERDRVAKLHAAGLAVTTYFNPMICTNHPRYGEAVAKGWLTKDGLGRPYEYRYQGSTQFQVGQVDFTAPGAGDFYGSLLDEAVRDGHDGWMEDFGEYTPADARSADGTPGTEMHNRYARLYHEAARRSALRAPKPLARFNRSGWTGSARFSQIVWGGDPTVDFGFDGLRSVVTQGLSMGLSGVSLWGTDIGGYFALGSRGLSPELLTRWIEAGFASGVMRTQANGFQVPDKARPQIFDRDVLPVWTRYARLRTQLYPYLAAAEKEYDATGLPLMRHLSLVAPDDPQAVARDDEYGLGGSLLAAPVLDGGATSRRVYLPAGDWVDVWRSTAMAGPRGALSLAAPRVLGGRQGVELPAPLDEMPLLARVGTLLPLVGADVDTLTDYGSGVVHLGDRTGARRLLVWPRGRSVAALGPEGGRASSNERAKSGWYLRLHDVASRRWDVEASLSTLARPFTPCRVTVGYRPLRRGRDWTYDRVNGVLRFAVRAGRATVRVYRRC